MQTENKFLNISFSKLAAFIGLLTAAAGLLIIIAWKNDISSLKTFGLGVIPIKANAGACFLLSGLALTLLQFSHPVTRTLSRLISVLVITIGLLSMAEIVFSVNLAIDDILFRKAFLSGSVAGPIRMALNAAICQVLTATILLFLSSKNIRHTFFLMFWMLKPEFADI